MKDNYSFVHISYQMGVGFVEDLIDFICTNFNDEEYRHHLWITRSNELYEAKKDKCDIIATDLSEVQMINKYGKKGNRIIIHGLHSSGFALMMLNPSLWKRIIWRTWGHDINLPTPNQSSVLKTCYRYVSYYIYHFITKHFAAAGIANMVDELKVKKVYGDSFPTCPMSYPKPPDESNRYKIIRKELRNTNNNHDVLKVMIGHSGFQIDNHLKIIEDISRFADEKVVFYIMIPYGDKGYIEQVVQKATELLKDKCIFIRERINYDEYMRFINDIDIAILDMRNSSALGNINLLLYFHKKLYLDPDGDIACAFKYIGIPFGNSKSLRNESFDVFKQKVPYKEAVIQQFLPGYYDSNYWYNQWQHIINYYGGNNGK
mgnify:CR=1 FL=1